MRNHRSDARNLLKLRSCYALLVMIYKANVIKLCKKYTKTDSKLSSKTVNREKRFETY